MSTAGPLDTFIPTFSAASGAVQVEFSRNTSKFALNQYLRLVPTRKMAGYYLKIDQEYQARIVNSSDFDWPVGMDRPTGEKLDFSFTQYACQRKAIPFYIGDEDVANADWDIVASHARAAATRAMSLRTFRAMTVLTDASNWDSNTGDSSDYGGGSWTDNHLQEGIQSVISTIIQSSAGAVTASDIVMIVNPTTAFSLSQSSEVKDYVKNFPDARAFVTGTGTYAGFGLPPTLFGLGNVVVDNSVRISTPKKASGAAGTRGYILDNNKAIFASRPGGLVQNDGPSFATVTWFAYEDMTVETFADPLNRRQRGSVVDNGACVVTAPVSGFLITDITATP